MKEQHKNLHWVSHPSISPDALHLRQLAWIQEGALRAATMYVEQSKEGPLNKYVLLAKGVTPSKLETDDSSTRGHIVPWEESLDQSTVEKIRAVGHNEDPQGYDFVIYES